MKLEGIVMKYRTLGKLDWNVSALGFGVMRMPIIGNDRGNIDALKSETMIRYAIDHGINYIDTAYPYHGGKSEGFVGNLLKKGYLKNVKLATKMPTWLVHSQADMDKFLCEQLNRLQTDHVDFYLLHGLDKATWAKMLKLNVIDWMEKMMKRRTIIHVGFSFHDEYDVFQDIIDGYDQWDLCQIQLNYMDVEYQAGTKGLKYAASKGLGVVVMEPIAGGLLAVTPPEEVQAIWDEAETKRTPADWALQWVWHHPEVSVVLSGMSTLDQVVENVTSTDCSDPGTLTKNELDLIARVRNKYREYGLLGCTDCKYCMPCPEGVDIPHIFALYNEYFMKNRDTIIKQKYNDTMPPEHRARKCIKCGDCEDKCPQHLPIRNILTKASYLFEPEN
jgi:predicted aldo/keto reductase-like oxidoreductase